MSKQFDLSGRVAIVTGGNGGIGLGMAEGLARAGASLMIAGRNAGKNAAAVKTLQALGAKAAAVEADVTQQPACQALIAATLAQFGRLDILINNAGTSARGEFESVTDDIWQADLELKLFAAIRLARLAIPHMKAQGGGRIINIGSISAQTPRPDAAPYTATKMAIEGLTRSLTLDGRRFNIVSSVIHTGPTASNFNAARGGPGKGKTPADFIMFPHDLGRLATLMCTLPDEVNLFSAIILPNHMPSFIGRG